MDFGEIEEVGKGLREVDGGGGGIDISVVDYFVGGIEEEELCFGGVCDVELYGDGLIDLVVGAGGGDGVGCVCVGEGGENSEGEEEGE